MEVVAMAMAEARAAQMERRVFMVSRGRCPTTGAQARGAAREQNKMPSVSMDWPKIASFRLRVALFTGN